MHRSTGSRIALFLRRSAMYAGIALLMLYILFPIYWTLISSFKTPVNFFEVDYWPTSLSLQAYELVLANAAFRQGIFVSLIVTALVVALTLGLGVLAGFAIGRLHFRGRGALRYTILAMIVVPQIAYLGGLYLIISNPCSIVGLGCPGVSLYDSIWALIGSYPDPDTAADGLVSCGLFSRSADRD
jgi:trehalose/maltose transport system permease protein